MLTGKLRYALAASILLAVVTVWLMPKRFTEEDRATVLSEASTPTRPSPVERSADMASAANSTSSPATTSTVTRVTRYTSGKRRMLADFNAATGYRAFLDKAFANPAAGGLTYANYVIQVCSDFFKSDKTTANQDQQAAAALLTARCDFSKTEAWQEMQAVMSTKGLSLDDDPALGAILHHLKTAQRTSEDLKSTVSTIISDSDPVSLGNLITINSPMPENFGEKTPEYFDGKWYAGGSQATLDTAWILARCQLGMACGADSTAALEACVEKRWCGGGVQEEIAAGFEGHPDEFAEINRVATRLVQVIQTKNAEAFVAPETYSHP